LRKVLGKRDKEIPQGEGGRLGFVVLHYTGKTNEKEDKKEKKKGMSTTLAGLVPSVQYPASA